MLELTPTDKEELVQLAKTTIESKLIRGAKQVKPDPPSPAMIEKRGCFVTLHKKGALRGCIGTIEPVTPLISCVEENAINAAFNDPRFPRLSRDELSDIDLEISALTIPRDLDYSDGEDLLKKLKPGVHGVILSREGLRSTFLPQVWEQLPDPKIFLEHLCTKAGMDQDCWKDGETTVQIYEVEYFS